MKFILSLLVFSTLSAATVLPSQAEQLPLRLLTEHKPPGTYRNARGDVAGATVELIRLVQQRLNEPGNIELLPWARAFDMAKQDPIPPYLKPSVIRP